MFYYLLAGKSSALYTLYMAISVLGTFGITFVCLKLFKGILPKDQGRAFAVNGALSEGKPRGAGLLLLTAFVLSAALFVPLDLETIIYLVCIYAAMLTGYFDDAAEKPWGNLKKGLFDLAIALGVAFTSWHFHGTDIYVHLISKSFTIPAPVYIILAAVLVWTAINVTNCSDGVDGLCSSLVMTVLVPLFILCGKSRTDSTLIIVMFLCLCAYLWFNCSPSKMLMGDAGSRALGVFLAVMFLKSSAPFTFIPFAIVIILDGGLGLLKLSFRRFLKWKNFMEGIRTPLHDHARKNKGWSDTQVVTRFVIIQIVVTFAYMCIV